MSPSRLKFVREDSRHVVMTEHPDYIHPRALSEELTAQYGEKQFQISLRRNIYVIYINIEVAGKHLVCESVSNLIIRLNQRNRPKLLAMEMLETISQRGMQMRLAFDNWKTPS